MLPELTQAVISRFEKRYHVVLTENEVTDVYGSQEGIAHIGLCLCNPGDVVLVPNPGYPIFSLGPSLAGADVHTYDLIEENNYLPELEKIDKKLLDKTKFMILSYPLNPVCSIAKN